jgi:hypothetical protein
MMMTRTTMTTRRTCVADGAREQKRMTKRKRERQENDVRL